LENDVAEQERGAQHACKKIHLPGQMTKKLWKGRRRTREVNAQGSKGGMLLGWEGLGEQVAEVDGAGDVGDEELVLLCAASAPIEAHVNAFRFFGPGRFRGQTARTLIITQDSGGGLGASEAG
jgi:hypothetical protein